MTTKQTVSLVIIGIVAVILFLAIGSTVERNDAQNWQVWQHVSGKVEIVSTPGWYLCWFGQV